MEGVIGLILNSLVDCIHTVCLHDQPSDSSSHLGSRHLLDMKVPGLPIMSCGSDTPPRPVSHPSLCNQTSVREDSSGTPFIVRIFRMLH
jgi:hypothetical protein